MYTGSRKRNTKKIGEEKMGMIATLPPALSQTLHLQDELHFLLRVEEIGIVVGEIEA